MNKMNKIQKRRIERKLEKWLDMEHYCSSVCECFSYVPEGTYYKYKISRFVCMHSKFNGRKTGHKIINKKYVICDEAPDWCPKRKGKLLKMNEA